MTAYNDSIGDVDIIFAGGGTAACVTAGRLAKLYPDLKILLIEAGKNNYNDRNVVNAGIFMPLLDPEAKTTIPYKARASEHLNGREALVGNGGILGGGSSVNYMMYSRAQAIDFDNWNSPGWTAKDVLPICNQMETYHINKDDPEADRSKHGYSGPIQISDGGFRSGNIGEFMSSIKRIGFKEIEDLQDGEHIGGFSRCHRNVSPEGKRQDAAHVYIHPLIQSGHQNLYLLLETEVLRVIFSGLSTPRAVGVECKSNSALQPELAASSPRIIKAKKLIVLAAGALSTPQILERSGVGDSSILKKLNIRVISNLPGVGENYQDHNHIMYAYKTSLEPSQTFDGKPTGEKDPKMGWNGIDICGKIRPTDAEVEALGREYKEAWDRDFAPHPTRPLLLCGVMNAFLAANEESNENYSSTTNPAQQYMSIGAYTAYPYSRGSIHITSRNKVAVNYENGYDFDAGFLSHPLDLKTQLWGYKVTRKIARSLTYVTGEVKYAHPPFNDHSDARAVEVMTGPILEDVTYSAEDDAVIEDWIREKLSTTWHSLGTCAMRDRGKGGVVDQSLNVYGTRGLKVADLSIVPENVGANTNNTAFLVGEKAAIIIGKELEAMFGRQAKL